MTDFVLVHGAFRGSWAWNRIQPLLEQHGHRVFTPDLTDPEADLYSYIDALESTFVDHDLNEVIMVGHSQGGFVIKAASDRLAPRSAHLVFLDAPVPANGQTAFDFRPPGTPRPPVERGDIIAPRPVTTGDGLTEEQAAFINDRLVAQPVSPSMEPVVLQSPEALTLPETYVFFSRTPGTYPCAITRADLDKRAAPYLVIDAPHDAVVSHPIEIAEILLALAGPTDDPDKSGKTDQSE